MSEKPTLPPRDGPSSAIMGSTAILGAWTWGASTAGSSRTAEDMEAEGCAGRSTAGLTGVCDTAWPPEHPAAAAAALPGAACGAAIFFSTGLFWTGWAARGFAAAGRPGAEGALACPGAGGGAEAPANFAWVAALTASGTAAVLAGAGGCFGAPG